MSTVRLGAYTGFHEMQIKRGPCAGGDCACDLGEKCTEPRSALAIEKRSYWKCKACTQAALLESLANTIRCGDNQRLATGIRLERMYKGSTYVPLAVSKKDAEVVSRFKKLGGIVSNLRTAGPANS